MPYNINNYCGSFLVSVQNSTICTTSTSLGLIGQNSVNFGLALNENFVKTVKNFRDWLHGVGTVFSHFRYGTCKPLH